MADECGCDISKGRAAKEAAWVNYPEEIKFVACACGNSCPRCGPSGMSYAYYGMNYFRTSYFNCVACGKSAQSLPPQTV